MKQKTIFENDVIHLFKEIEKLKKTNNKEGYLLENTYFLNGGQVLCMPRVNGVSRFPYGIDGFTLWAYSSGYISINESTFYLVLPSDEGKEPYLAFYIGEKQKDGTYVPISLLGRGRNLLEKKVERYCVYSKDSVYYLTKTKKGCYACRIFVTESKKVNFDIYAKSLHDEEIYVSSFMNCLFKYASGESVETKWFKKCTYQDDTFAFESPEDIDRHTHVLNFGVIHREYVKGEMINSCNTTSRSVYVGGKENSLAVATSLVEGHFAKEKHITHFTDTAIAGDIVKYRLNKNKPVIVHYTMEYTHLEDEYKILQNKYLSFDESESFLYKKRKSIKHSEVSPNMLHFNFEDWQDGKINTYVLNQFLNYVIYQTEYCGLAKNSGALFLGVRDVMQQIEAALIWKPKACRQKILEVLSFIDSTGNPPRQYSIPPKNANPIMDLRDFIDQGVWIISTIYTYLSYTGDYSILKEKIGYYDRVGAGVVLSKRRDNVLQHMIQIMDYLTTHIDPNTKCLRAMYGDWNDALDGLGISANPHEKYGNGVSSMATFQLYSNLNEMIDLLQVINKHQELVKKYQIIRDELVEGIKKYIIVEEKNQRKVIHGWGDNRAYLVGSFHDVDGQSRDSLTANAFYVLSNMYKHSLVEKDDILRAYDNLDSKYGLKTFEPYFAENVKGVGRIVNLPKGTAENGATYIHGTLFGTLSLFLLGEEKKAYQQIEKILPLTHQTLTTTPFVMPNSYSYNVEEDMDGESMSDWYTGSANTLIKTLIKGAFGIFVDLHGVNIDVRSWIASQKAECAINIRGTQFKVTYQKDATKKGKVAVNGQEVESTHLHFVFNEKKRLNDKKMTIVIYC